MRWVTAYNLVLLGLNVIATVNRSLAKRFCAQSSWLTCFIDSHKGMCTKVFS